MSSCEIIAPELGDVKQVQLTSVQGNTLHIQAVLPVTNENWHRIRVYHIDLQVYVGGRKLGEMKDVERIRLKRKTTTEQVIGLELEMPGLLSGGLSLMRLMSQETVDLNIRGEVTAGAFLVARKTVRVNETFTVSLK